LEKLARGGLVLVTYAIGLGSYVAVRVGNPTPIVISGIILPIVAVVLLVVGWFVLQRRPQSGVWPLDIGWTLTLIVVGATIEGAAVWLAVFLTGSLSSLSGDVAKVVGAAIVAGVNVVTGILFVKDFEAGKGGAYPGAAFKMSVQHHYKGKFLAQSEAYRAIWEDRLPEIKGWGFTARRKRARLLHN
jgi:hypothetical protein